MDIRIFQLINGLAGRWGWLDQIGTFFAQYFLYVFLGVVLLLWFDKNVRKNVYVAVITAGISRLLIVEVLKRLVDSPRPFEFMNNIHLLLVDEESGKSFPSGHAVIFFSFAFAFYGTKYFWPFLFLAVIGSFARIFVGVHYPFDILASVFIAAIFVWTVRKLFKNQLLS